MLLALLVKKHWASAVRADVNRADLWTTPVTMVPQLKASNGRHLCVAKSADKRRVWEVLEGSPVCIAFPKKWNHGGVLTIRLIKKERVFRLCASFRCVVLLCIRKLSMMPVMSEDEIGEIKDELKAYKEQPDSLKEDLRILILFSNPYLIGQVQQYVSGVPNAVPSVKEKYVKFLQRYGSLAK
jgi:hypothetical protein